MKYFFLLSLVISLTLSCKQTTTTDTSMTFDPIPVTYPQSVKDTTVSDDYFGTTVADPYRWLEDDHSDETKAWVDKQNEATFAYLDKIPFRQSIEDRLTKLWNYAKYSVPFKVVDKYYFFKNDGLQNQSVLYVQDALDGPAEMVLDPNTFSEDGTVALSGLDFSKDGKYLSYQVSDAGSDWKKILVMDMTTNQKLADTISWVKFSGISWQNDGFYYSRYPKPNPNDDLKGKNIFHQVYYHKVGTDQADDELIYADRSNEEHNFYAQTTEDEKYMVVSVAESTSGNALYFKDLTKPSSPFIAITKSFESDFSVVDNIGHKLLVLTNQGAPNQRLLAIDTRFPEEKKWKEIIPESKNVLRGVSLLGNKLFAQYLENASSKVEVYSVEGEKEYDLTLPEIGTVGSLSGKRDESEAFYSFSSFTRPNTIYKLDVTDGKSAVFKKPNIEFDSDQLETKQFFFTSKDGTKVPMFVTHKKGLKLDGKRPTLLYGYGGFNISILPRFSVVKSILMENDGVYVVANIRGGGEFGQEWHLAGTKEKKQNVFDDFIGAAEFLIENQYTSAEKLAIEGGSNGGLLVGACMTQRPELFKVAFPRVGVLDMLRYHQFTIGRAWAYDYGLSEDKEGFAYLSKYSPVHNVKEVAYPATMVMTADHDDRVVPAHSFKFAATLQEHHQGDNPVLIRIEKSAGHGAGKPTEKIIEESADMLAFLFYNTQHPVKY